MAWMRSQGRSVKTTLNTLGLLHGIFEHGLRRGWVTANPCKLVDKPRDPDADADIRFLDAAELEAVIAAVPDDKLGQVEHAMYLTAAMTGMRQGELLALRWLDIDWTAKRVRVRRNFVRGEYGTPKSKRSTRSVPLADRVGGALDRLYQSSAYQSDEDLVFAHPDTGKPIDRSKLLKRFKAALKRAGGAGRSASTICATRSPRAWRPQGVPMRTLQEWLGHRDFKTTMIYADYAPSASEAELVETAFAQPEARGIVRGIDLSETERN